ncbi:MAG: hypothetical protein VX641_07435 [Planctomycetota bacterium]|nr:hypothetical protein [Planctomycetota bacterium]
MALLVPFLVLPLCLAAVDSTKLTASDPDPLKTMDARDAREIRKHLPGIVMGPVKDMEGIGAAEDWCPLKSTRFTYERPGSSKTVELSIRTVDRAPGSTLDEPAKGWALELPNGTTRYFRSDPDFGIVAPTDLSKSNGLIIRLDPPEPIVHQNAKVGEAVRRSIKVDIYDLHTPKSVAHSGTVTCTWTDLGGWRVKVPMGEYDTHLVRIEYQGSVGPASVDGNKYMFLAKGIGPVAFTDSREISAFLFFSESQQKAGILSAISHPEN